MIKTSENSTSSNDYYLEIDDPSDEIEIILPSESQNGNIRNLKRDRNKRKVQNYRKKSFSLKWPMILLFICLIYLFYDQMLEYIMEVLKSNPTIYSYYLYFESEIVNNTITGIFYTAIFGSLFFLAIPSEALFIYFLDSMSYPWIVILLLITVGNVCGLIFNYLFGRLLGERFVAKMFSKNFDKYQDKINSRGGIILLIGNILPGPIELLTIFYGSFKFPFVRYLYLVFMGRLIKYIILFILFTFYWDSITLFYNDIFNEFTNLKNIYDSVLD
jgi:membrane protein YqaA with SNARE-associated domain